MCVHSFEKSDRLIDEKVFKDPVHDYIHVRHQLILDLIDTKEVQRLRRIKQLGTTQFTFHGAEHSRFSHSLGVYEITRRIVDMFDRNYPNDWDPSMRLVTLCAALLHDVGHGPFSHTFEKIFETDHETITTDIILSENTEVNAVLKRVSLDFPNQVASVITKQHSNPQVVQLISSQIDADRMDYLQRDAFFTGATYGAFDLSRILRVIRPYKEGIAFEYQGLHAVEDYIVSRFQMYMQVYFHPASRGMEVTLDRLLYRAKQLYHEGSLFPLFPLLVPFFEEKATLQDYLKLDDGVLQTAITLWTESDDAYLSELAGMFLNRKPLKSVVFEKGKDDEIVESLRDIVGKLSYDKNLYTMTNSSSDLPYDYKLKSKTPIQLIHSDGTLVEISTVSSIVKSLSGILHGDHRLFVPKEFLEKDMANINMFQEEYDHFQHYIKNGTIIHPKD
ncbi:MAG: HD domain-containing protein [Alkalibacterium sp.]|uniref:HD domain-containing protein n=1 Tax=Alkalibacterium gilvum TaxID=1130080 RepID=A0A1H6RZF1_9LACT|nr:MULTISPECIES: HD domain-containing protein [Alkalibacterium]MDN6193515.1 HD domain-containing protein [Alkalibacterium sp.]MDN6294067.1 HD domain-containing protein [Alkalibacterium sp.]MDN6295675.1 HD domain-containing protein [Alkalibacterium sp.]MDN6326547.1 HD domain-containing protein [Alkalibacterium sp.]MDN6397857.1 HD domain-containing protein [Alkalibacterium sp.]